MKYAELNDDVKERLRQNHAEHAAYDSWWDCTKEQYKEGGTERGFDIDDMYFSGFWSQGDGASWTGQIGIKQFLTYHLKPSNPQFAQYTVLGELVSDRGIADKWIYPRVKVTTSGQYSHQYSMDVAEVEVEECEDDDTVAEGPLAGANVGELILQVINPALDDLNTWMQDEARDYAGEYYKALEADYEYITGEASLIERDEEYTEDGEIDDERGDAHKQVALFEEPALAGCPAY